MKKAKQHSPSKNNKAKNLMSPKGMRDIINDEYYNFQGFFEKEKGENN